MGTWLAVAAGGAIGALGRYLVSGWIVGAAGRGFPWGTLGVNLIGSCLMGFLFIWVTQELKLAPVWQAIMVAGFTGAFTTFSTFALEALNLMMSGRMLAGLVYVAVSVVACLGMVALGMKIARVLL
ncbi:MAG: fluoride efflux transporter CrcB [Cobetia sp.]|jgi:CrcB protein|uniref:Fluoride-specific ion channel FluC n=2 Tax=Halomonadaceae TaxID=28256 RepID=A0AAP4X1U6_9GAMM|nr:MULTISPECIES: fluoride efflux transporter CrcB [Cobetia]AVV33495.1 fluoride efflux transporter CrcB [Halomonas sp. SF2003]MBE2168347.1 fluoride efflux transporter CrcB [Cobetia sp. 2AS1]MBR9797488.1 fluoride efflux transporter CrcB [Gammaproteobacteria bacterium]MBS4152379.1 fluoride efflux transporter CrcB [Cobetia sp. MC34]NVN54947.1 fluoride efflux transporter CrcB [bacterium Scap17]TCJ25156.1 fluoride efflux transporter CrcB [Halomonas sp. GDM18]BBO55472.1 putative fluoride ion transp|tara:strand:+ start:86438 stop:86815 length:378 start_codon:yes stop_codon:yes gene_type:complete